MPVSFSPGWVNPPHETGGLDHLGVRAPVIHIYGELLPGITNVTDRARYYSFYAWLIWQLDNQGHRNLDESTRLLIRQADCLFTLIAERHALNSPSRDIHALGTVGNSVLGAAVRSLGPDQVLDLTEYALVEPSQKRYFKNRLGGLGQYYIGSLRDARILAGDAVTGFRYTVERGAPLAQTLDEHVNGERFWACLMSGQVSAADLDALDGFCPCHLAEPSAERDLLASIMFALDVDVPDPVGPVRRQTLRLLLDLAVEIDGVSRSLSVDHFRGAIYGGALPGGKPWTPPAGLRPANRRWLTYVTNEILSLGLQGTFYGVLACRRARPDAPSVAHGKALAAWFLETGPGSRALDRLAAGSFEEVLASTSKALPDQMNWEDPAHELSLAMRIAQLGSMEASDDVLSDIVVDSMRLLASLAVRLAAADDPYGHLTFPQGYFDVFPLNLRRFRSAAAGAWRRQALSDWMITVIDQWCVSAHMRVALRKIRNQSQSTFQVRPTDQGLIVVGAPLPEFSSPRFRQARQMLVDLGALQSKGNDCFAVSAFGHQLLDKEHA